MNLSYQLFSFFIFCNSLGQISDNLQSPSINGKIKKIQNFYFDVFEGKWVLTKSEEFDVNGKIISEETFNNEATSKRIFIYSLAGDQKEIIQYRGDELTEHTYNYYNNTHRLIKSETFDNKNKQVYKSEFAYDSSQRLIEDYQYTDSDIYISKRTYKYNLKNDVIETNDYNYNGQLLRTFTYSFKYSSDGKSTIKEKSFSTTRFIWEYKDNIIVKQTEIVLGQKNITTMYTLDGEEHKIEGISDGKNINIMYYYIYDSHQNWIEQYNIGSSGQKDGLKKRVITYY